MDYYKILNVSEDSSLKEIEQAYKDLSSFYNPENNVSKNAYKKFREVSEAYKVLSEIKQREMYDRLHVSSVESTCNNVGELIEIESYLSNKSVVKYNEEIINDNVSDVHISVNLSYLYYLVGSEYTLHFDREIVVKNEGECSSCLGTGKVRKENKVSTCPDCLGSGVSSIKKFVEETIVVEVNDEYVTLEKEDYKIFINFNFYDKDSFRIENNEIFVEIDVSEEEYDKGINFNLVKDDIVLNISSLGFNDSTYTFLDKIIHIKYKLSKYRGKDIEAYLLSDKELLYLNLNDFTYTESADQTHTYKLVANQETLVLEGLGKKGYNDKNGNLIVKVIRVKNDKDNMLFFNKSIKRVSANLFKLKGNYNGHNFKTNKAYDFDEDYIYLPSRAYKLKSKTYLVFKLIYALLYPLVPFILFLIMGFSFAYVLVTCIYSVLYLVLANLLMEVRV